MKILSISAAVAVVFAFASCAKTELAPEETSGFNSIEEFEDWAGDRLVKNEDKETVTLMHYGEEHTGTLYTFYGDEEQQIVIASGESEKGSDKADRPPFYNKRLWKSSFGTYINCSEDDDECRAEITDDGGVKIWIRKDLAYGPGQE